MILFRVKNKISAVVITCEKKHAIFVEQKINTLIDLDMWNILRHYDLIIRFDDSYLFMEGFAFKIIYEIDYLGALVYLHLKKQDMNFKVKT